MIFLFLFDCDKLEAILALLFHKRIVIVIYLHTYVMLRLLIVSALVHAMRGSSAASGTRATSAASRASSAATMPITDVHFEIFGKVQGVFFRKNTKDQADKLGLRGWCKNTSQGTVRGQVQGPSDKVQNMMHWLKSTGSPQSKIERAEFTDEKKINKYTFESFDIVRD